MARNHVFQLRLNDLEWAKLHKLAALQQVTLAEVLRDLIKSAKIPESPESADLVEDDKICQDMTGN